MELPDILKSCMRGTLNQQERYLGRPKANERVYLYLPISRIDFTPAETKPTGHLESSGKSAETSMAGTHCERGYSSKTKPLTVFATSVHTS